MLASYNELDQFAFKRVLDVDTCKNDWERLMLVMCITMRKCIIKLIFYQIYYYRQRVQDCLEAFPVDDRGTRLVVLLLGDPHLLEGRERGQDGATDPDGVFAFWGSNDLDLHGRGGEGSQFLLETVSNSWEHGGSARADNVTVQVLTDIDVALHDRVVGGFVDTGGFHSQERGLEECLSAT